MTVTVAAAITALFGSVIRPVSDALVDWEWIASVNNRVRSAAKRTLHMETRIVPYLSDERAKASTNQPRYDKESGPVLILINTLPTPNLYQQPKGLSGVSQDNICLEKRLSPDVCSRLA